jgi:hypothetical protein
MKVYHGMYSRLFISKKEISVENLQSIYKINFHKELFFFNSDLKNSIQETKKNLSNIY